jgi:hypothetical protein
MENLLSILNRVIFQTGCSRVPIILIFKGLKGVQLRVDAPAEDAIEFPDLRLVFE